MNKSVKYFINIRLLYRGDNIKTAFGPGIACLLKGIDKTGSINKATQSMGMAYSKAWRILATAEEQLGFALIERKVPEGSSLTDKGRQFLSLYDRMQEAANNAVGQVLNNTDFEF